ncbi:hypothetical protein [Planctomycetes bacterium Pan216]
MKRVASVYLQPIYDDADGEIYDHVNAVRSARNEQATAQARDQLFACFDRLLARPDVDFGCQVFNRVAELDAKPFERSALRGWVDNVIRRLENLEQQAALVIAIFVPFVDDDDPDGIEDQQAEWLFGQLGDPRTEWVVFLTYASINIELYAQRMHHHYEHYRRRMRTKGIDKPEFPNDCLRRWEATSPHMQED